MINVKPHMATWCVAATGAAISKFLMGFGADGLMGLQRVVTCLNVFLRSFLAFMSLFLHLPSVSFLSPLFLISGGPEEMGNFAPTPCAPVQNFSLHGQMSVDRDRSSISATGWPRSSWC